MLLVNLKALMQKKSAIEGRKITYKVIEEEIEIKSLTLSRISSNPKYNFSRKDLEELIRYFDCEPNDLFTLIEDK